MKTIRLLKNSLSHLFRCETAASIMILCSLFFVYFSQFTFVGVMNPLRQLQQASSSYTSICITPSDSSIAADTLAFFESSPLGEMRNAFVVDLDTSGERPQMVGWKGTAFTRWHALEAGMSFFDERQVESTEHIAIMGVTSLGARPSEQTVNGITYSIIDHGSLSISTLLRRFPNKFDYYVDEYGIDDELIIPYRTFFADGYVPDAIVLDMKEALAGSDAAIIEQIAASFPNCDIHLVGSSAQTKARAKTYEQMQSLFLGVSLLSALSVFTFFNGWIRQNARQYQIYLLCGATRTKVFLLLLMEWGVLTVVACVMAYLALMAVTPVLNYINVSVSIQFGHCAAIAALGLLFSYLSSLRTLWAVCKTNYRQGG